MPELSVMRDWANQIGAELGFTPERDLQVGKYYNDQYVRDLVIQGTWQGRLAVLKVYDDPRLCFEPKNLELFHKRNTSQRLHAPKLFASKILSPKKGWLLMELLPSGGEWFPRPMSSEQRKIFLELFLEYRKSWPTDIKEERFLPGQLSSGEYHAFRINKWLQLASDAEEAAKLAGEKTWLLGTNFMEKYERALRIIRRQFSDRPMILCHGHFKHSEVYVINQGAEAYLIDFAHVKHYPVGYELAFMAWADWLIGNTWKLGAVEWRTGMQSWMDELILVAGQLEYARPAELIQASILERLLGTILADVVASSRPADEKQAYLDRHLPLLEELVNILDT